MQLRVNRRQALGMAGAAFCACVACSADAAALSYKLVAEEIGPRCWGVFGAREYFTVRNGANVANTAFAEVPDGIVVVDTGPSRRYGEALLALIAATVPNKRVIRVFNTHHHPDHFLGNQVFDPAIVAASPGVIANIKAQGGAFADNMYRLVGDWMRGTLPTPPGRAIEEAGEDVGGRRFAYLPLSGHTSADFVIRDEETGLLFPGDLAFLNRAPTTPHADLPAWRAAIRRLGRFDREMVVPGHGPLDATGASFAQTLDYLDWLEGTLRHAAAGGLTMNEAMALPIPKRFGVLGVLPDEYQRSVVHLYQRFEDQELPGLAVER